MSIALKCYSYLIIMVWNSFSVYEDECKKQDLRAVPPIRRSNDSITLLYYAIDKGSPEMKDLREEAARRNDPSLDTPEQRIKSRKIRFDNAIRELEHVSVEEDSSLFIVYRKKAEGFKSPVLEVSMFKWISIMPVSTGEYRCIDSDLKIKDTSIVKLIYNYRPSAPSIMTRERIISQIHTQKEISYESSKTSTQKKVYLPIHFQTLFSTP